MIVGFTGTREGMTESQKHSFRSVMIHSSVNEFHHGDCVGADADAHTIIRRCTMADIHVRPGDRSDYAAGCIGDMNYDGKPYLKRNNDIVLSCDVLVATPNSNEEIKRSGTWYTVRKARVNKRTIVIIWPDGSVEIEQGKYQDWKPIGC